MSTSPSILSDQADLVFAAAIAFPATKTGQPAATEPAEFDIEEWTTNELRLARQQLLAFATDMMLLRRRLTNAQAAGRLDARAVDAVLPGIAAVEDDADAAAVDLGVEIDRRATNDNGAVGNAA